MANKLKIDVDVLVWQIFNSAYDHFLQKEATVGEFTLTGKCKPGYFSDLYEGTVNQASATQVRNEFTAVKNVLSAYKDLSECGEERLSNDCTKAVSEIEKFVKKLDAFIGKAEGEEKVKPDSKLSKAISEARTAVVVAFYDKPTSFDKKHPSTIISAAVERFEDRQEIPVSGFRDDLAALKSYFSDYKPIISDAVTTLDDLSKDRSLKTAFRDQTASTPQEEAKARANSCRDDLAKVDKALELISKALGKPGATAEKTSGKQAGADKELSQGKGTR